MVRNGFRSRRATHHGGGWRARHPEPTRHDNGRNRRAERLRRRPLAVQQLRRPIADSRYRPRGGNRDWRRVNLRVPTLKINANSKKGGGRPANPLCRFSPPIFSFWKVSIMELKYAGAIAAGTAIILIATIGALILANLRDQTLTGREGLFQNVTFGPVTNATPFILNLSNGTGRSDGLNESTILFNNGVLVYNRQNSSQTMTPNTNFVMNDNTTNAWLNVTSYPAAWTCQTGGSRCNITVEYNRSIPLRTNATNTADDAIDSLENFGDMLPIVGTALIAVIVFGMVWLFLNRNR